MQMALLNLVLVIQMAQGRVQGQTRAEEAVKMQGCGTKGLWSQESIELMGQPRGGDVQRMACAGLPIVATGHI